MHGRNESTAVETNRQSNQPGGGNFARFLYNQNPFYLISAAVVLYGFNGAADQAGAATRTWGLAGLFAGYTTLLAVSAWAIVRFGKVWDDARSILMVLLLLLLALSSSVDVFVVQNPSMAMALAMAGFSFAVGLAEFLIRSLGIRFRALFRIPMYLMMAISFFFPVAFSLRLEHFPHTDVRNVILVFPLLCAGALLSLMPAIRKGRRYAAKNGTPWHWPLFPYSAFVLLTIGLCGRIAMVTWSFDSSAGFGMLGSWLYVPILLAVAWLLFEMGVAEQSASIRRVAMLLMLLGPSLAPDWSFQDSGSYYGQLTEAVGSPFWLTIVGLVFLFGLVRLRGFLSANWFVGALLLGLAIVRPDGSVAETVGDLEGWAFGCMAIFLLVCRGWSLSSRRAFAATSFVSVPVAQYATPLVEPMLGSGQALALEMAGVMAGVVLVAGFAVGLLFGDRFARQLRVILAFAFPIVAVVLAGLVIYSGHRTMAPIVVTGAVAAASLLFWVVTRGRLHLSSASISIVATIAMVCSRQSLPGMEGLLAARDIQLLQFLVVGIGCLVLGLFVSAAKAGWSAPVSRGFANLWQEIAEPFGACVEEEAAC